MSTTVRKIAASLHVFLDGIIDYAGLFPPSSLSMRASVENYARYLADPQSWALGRFVLPAARLTEFRELRASVKSTPWRLSATLSGEVGDELAAIAQFNRTCGDAKVNAVEVRIHGSGEIAQLLDRQPPETQLFFEVDPERAAELLPAVRHMGGHAKLRTGGVIESAFPALEQIASFIAGCAELGVSFKATAGLHHPLCCVRALTYDADSPRAPMHGFVNLFTAAALAWSAVEAGNAPPMETMERCLADGDRGNWHFAEDGMAWIGGSEPMRISLGELQSMRRNFALSFGSCSFEEPISELRELDLL